MEEQQILLSVSELEQRFSAVSDQAKHIAKTLYSYQNSLVSFTLSELNSITQLGKVTITTTTDELRKAMTEQDVRIWVLLSLSSNASLEDITSLFQSTFPEQTKNKNTNRHLIWLAKIIPEQKQDVVIEGSLIHRIE